MNVISNDGETQESEIKTKKVSYSSLLVSMYAKPFLGLDLTNSRSSSSVIQSSTNTCSKEPQHSSAHSPSKAPIELIPYTSDLSAKLPPQWPPQKPIRSLKPVCLSPVYDANYTDLESRSRPKLPPHRPTQQRQKSAHARAPTPYHIVQPAQTGTSEVQGLWE